MNRTLAIGDIHGGYRALKQLLDRLQLDPSDELIFLGDYVDGWSESALVIEELAVLSSTNPCTFIIGNHDVWLLEYLQTGSINSIWVQHGGRATLESYSGYNRVQLDKHREILEGMKTYHIDEKDRLFVHAGFSSMHGPQRESYSTNFGWDRTLWEMAVALHGRIEPDDSAYPQRLQLFDEIFIGHTPTIDYGVHEPWNRMNVWNVDTGAAFLGRLSAIEVDTKEVWQSDPVHTLYPGEKGRNQ